ncbi:MAG: FCD domain-containing protein [Burkholderiales bacterium]|nr:FCD domain-containing protein [Burkholderiales bacterium]
MNVTSLRRRADTANVFTSAEHAIEARRAHSLVSICQMEIERMILDADLEMGARINELALAARLGISRGPVREACRSLVQAGLLETRANRGFFVRRLTQKEVVDLYDLRAGLMHLAGELVARNATAEQLANLREMVNAMDAARIEGDIERFQNINAEFHAALVTATDNRRLDEVYRGLANESRLFRRRGLVSAGAMESSNREHRAIVDAIASRDAARAAATMENHILQGKARFLSAAVDEIGD